MHLCILACFLRKTLWEREARSEVSTQSAGRSPDSPRNSERSGKSRVGEGPPQPSICTWPRVCVQLLNPCVQPRADSGASSRAHGQKLPRERGFLGGGRWSFRWASTMVRKRCSGLLGLGQRPVSLGQAALGIQS